VHQVEARSTVESLDRLDRGERVHDLVHAVRSGERVVPHSGVIEEEDQRRVF
jgi:hypothetical protein